MRCVPVVMASCLLCLVGSAPDAWAQPQALGKSSSDKVTAEALFREGRKLMGESRYAEACNKFEASQRLDPGVGTMLNLAECYEKTGRTASAWAEFREVISAAREAESAEREELARKRAEALEAKLSRLTIRLSSEATQILGLEVRRDGAILDSAEFGSAIPVDPGKHSIEATAPGRAKWFKTLDVGPDGQQELITIPELAAAVDTKDSPTPSASTAQSSSPTGSSRKAMALGLGAVGVIGVGVGGFFGLRAASAWSDVKAQCESYPSCSRAVEDDAERARSSALVSTIGFGLGALGLASGAVLWFTTERAPAAQAVQRRLGRSRVTAQFSVTPSSVLVRGSF